MSLEEIGTSALAFVREHQAWAGPVVFLFAFCESVAFVSLLVPATVILLGLGVLMGENGLDFFTVWVAAAAGAVCGDALSYWLGKKFSRRVGDIWPLSRYPGTYSARRAVFQTIWRSRPLRWPFPGAPARLVAARGGHLRDAVASFSGDERCLGVRLVGRDARAGRAWRPLPRALALTIAACCIAAGNACAMRVAVNVRTPIRA